MKLQSASFPDGGGIPARCAFCRADPKSHAGLSENKNPQLSWSDLPSGTRSLTLICHDPDVPGKADDVNQEGRVIPADLPRVVFYHWILVDLPPEVASIQEGEFSDGITPRGKSGPAAPKGARQGLNNYTDWFQSDPDMGGRYFGYDGPCPPWNDEIVHHYHFTLYALDVERLPVENEFTGPQVLAAMEGHVLAKASIVGLYSLNPDVSV